MRADNFDELFRIVTKKISKEKMTLFQTDRYLYNVYREYKDLITYSDNHFDEYTFYSVIKDRDKHLKDDEHVRLLKLDGEAIIEKYNGAVLYGRLSDGRHYFNHFKRDNEGFWYFSWYEEEEFETT